MNTFYITSICCGRYLTYIYSFNSQDSPVKYYPSYIMDEEIATKRLAYKVLVLTGELLGFIPYLTPKLTPFSWLEVDNKNPSVHSYMTRLDSWRGFSSLSMCWVSTIVGFPAPGNTIISFFMISSKNIEKNNFFPFKEIFRYA